MEAAVFLAVLFCFLGSKSKAILLVQEHMSASSENIFRMNCWRMRLCILGVSLGIKAFLASNMWKVPVLVVSCFNMQLTLYLNMRFHQASLTGSGMEKLASRHKPAHHGHRKIQQYL